MALSTKKGKMYPGITTWNPFLGCRYNCTYCKPSFQRTVKRVYYCQGRKCIKCFNFEPHTHPNRLNKSLSSSGTVWPCAHGDVSFANPNFIKQVIRRTKNYSNKKFYWQSKNPVCFKKYLNDFPKDNTILLTTLETNRDRGYRKISQAPLPSKRYKDFENLNWDRKIVTIEPILDFDPEIFLEWIKSIHPETIWIGYNSKHTSVQLPEPEVKKAKDFIQELKKSGFKVRIKTMKSALPRLRPDGNDSV